MQFRLSVLSALVAGSLFGATAVLLAAAGGHDQAPPESHHPAYSDLHSAWKHGEVSAYNAWINEQAKALDALSDEELDARLRSYIDSMVEEDLWRAALQGPMECNSLRNLPWDAMIEEFPRQNSMIGDLAVNLNMALEPDATRQQRQTTLFRLEHELPALKKHRREALYKVMTDVYGAKQRPSHRWSIRQLIGKQRR